jgi:APA family basic amino acid/polyamine antiporter
MVFVHVAPMGEMRVTFDKAGVHNMDTGFIAGQYIFGLSGARIVAGLISFALVSSISAMTMAGPRVTQAIAQDFKGIGILSKTNKTGAPFMAIAMQTTISVIMILTGTFESIIKYIGFTLALSTLLTVCGIFIVRHRKQSEGNYKCWGYPVTPLIFIVFSLWMLVFLLKDIPNGNFEPLYGLGTVVLGIPFFYLGRPKAKVN